jgi:hypothetical protein
MKGMKKSFDEWFSAKQLFMTFMSFMIFMSKALIPNQ